MTEQNESELQPLNRQYLNPWFYMWFRPRQTVRDALKRYSARTVLVLATLSCVASWLFDISTTQLRSSLSLDDAVGMLTNLLWGLAGFYFSAFLLFKMNQWLGLKGSASFKCVLMALALSEVPFIWGILLSLPVFMVMVYGTFIGNENIFYEHPEIFSLGTTLSAINLLVTFWSMGLFVIALAEVNQYSVWKALINILIVMLMMIAVAAIIYWVF